MRKRFTYGLQRIHGKHKKLHRMWLHWIVLHLLTQDQKNLGWSKRVIQLAGVEIILAS